MKLFTSALSLSKFTITGIIKQMSKLRKKLDAEYEELVASGEEGKKGVKYAKEKFTKDEKEAEEEAEIRKQILEGYRKRPQYNRFLGNLLLEGLRAVEWPSGWTYKVAATDKGVVMEIQTKDKRFFRTAFRATGQGEYDLNAINNYVERAWLLIDKETSNDIILP